MRKTRKKDERARTVRKTSEKEVALASLEACGCRAATCLECLPECRDPKTPPHTLKDLADEKDL